MRPEAVKAILGLPASEDRIVVAVTDSAGEWADAWCKVTGRPAGVVVEYSVWDEEEGAAVAAEAAYAGDIAGNHVRALLERDDLVAGERIEVTVCTWWLRFTHADYVA